MKRCGAFILAVLIITPLFCITAFAETLDMRDVVPEEYLPLGYVTANGPFREAGRNVLFGYSIILKNYFYISFTGTVEFLWAYNRWQLKFSEPESIQMRMYECSGRNIFSTTEGHELTIKIPASKLADVIPADTMTASGRLVSDIVGRSDLMNDKWVNNVGLSFDTGRNFGVFDADIVDSDIGSGVGFDDYYASGNFEYSVTAHLEGYLDSSFESDSVITETFTIPASSINLQALNIPITVDDVTSQNFDYYIVQQVGSGVTSSLDAPYGWSHSNGLITISNTQNFGFVPIFLMARSVAQSYDSAEYRFSTGAYYQNVGTYSQLFNYELISDLLPDNIRLSLDILNKYFSHFGYPVIEYYPDLWDKGDQLTGEGNRIESAAGTIDTFERDMYDDYNTGIAEINPGGFAVGTELTSGMLFITQLWTQSFNQLGDFKTVVIFPLMVGLSMLVIGRIGSVGASLSAGVKRANRRDMDGD